MLNADQLEISISANKNELLRVAAQMCGRTLTDFIVDSACKAAVCVVKEYQQLNLSVRHL